MSVSMSLFIIVFWLICASICVSIHNYGNSSVFTRAVLCFIFALAGPLGFIIEIISRKTSRKTREARAV